MKPEHLLWVAITLLVLGVILPFGSLPTVGQFRLATQVGGIWYYVGVPVSLFRALDGKWRFPFWFGVFATAHGLFGLVRVSAVDYDRLGATGPGPGFQCIVAGGILLALVAHRQQRAIPSPQP